MKMLRILIPLLVGVVDALPFVYLLAAPVWPRVPTIVVIVCSFGPPVIGVATLTILMILRTWKHVPLSSDGFRIALVLAVVGMLEPLLYWI